MSISQQQIRSTVSIYSATPVAAQHFAPKLQPTKVHQIASSLCNAYTFAAGQIHLAGCTLEDRLVVCLMIQHIDNVQTEDQAREVYVAIEDSYGETQVDSQLLADELVDRLKLQETVLLEKPPFRISNSQLKYSQSVAERVIEDHFENVEILKVRFLWCKYAEGKLRFEIQEEMEDLPFSDWAQLLRAPEFQCPHSGIKTFQLDVTDDLQIAAAEAIVTCEVTGSRVLESESARCAISGKRAMLTEMAVCPVSNETVLKSTLVVCSQCQQRVSRNAISRKTCTTCRKLLPVKKADPRMACILGQYPGLDRLRRWSIGETRSAYIMVAKSLFRRYLVVLDKETLEPCHLASGSVCVRHWTALDESQTKEMLY